MKNLSLALLIGFFMSLSFLCNTTLAQSKEGSEEGNRAPDFSLPNTNREQVKLSSYRNNKNVVLIFYRGQW